MSYILIGGAWPYANGPLHIGHIAGLLNGDILARYHRQKGDQVLYVSGSDCHGTPITLKAKALDESPALVSERHHKEIVEAFDALNFSYDAYGTTKEAIHYENAKSYFTKLDRQGLVFEQEVPQHFCNDCRQFLADRYIIATCPHCGATSRGDECEVCNKPINLQTLEDPTCAICNNTLELLPNKNLYFKLSSVSEGLSKLLEEKGHTWRQNSINLTKRYIDEGVRDRAYSRDLEWGIPIPKEGYQHKTIYIWLENVLGYSSMVKKWCHRHGEDPDLYLKASDNLKSYYVHAKDNIPFHTLILPGILLGANDNDALPDQIVSNEYLTLEGKKISTSSGWALWVNDLIKKYEPESLRHYLTFNAAEKKDTNFTFEDFIYTHNSDLVGQLGNLVNRTLAFINKYLDGRLPLSPAPNYIVHNLQDDYDTIANLIEEGHIKDAYRIVFDRIKYANVLFDKEKPWVTRTEDPIQCQKSLLEICYLIANIANLLSPFLPETSSKIQSLIQIEPTSKWAVVELNQTIKPAVKLGLLFERIPIEQIAQERESLLSLTT